MPREKKDPFRMTASEINRELDALDRKRAKNTAAMIAGGRGHERPSETEGKSDKLSVELREIMNRRSDLRREVERRYGPGAPSRLPIGRGK